MAPLGIGLGAERIGLAALRFPRIALLAIGLFIALIAISLPRLTFDDDIHRVFLSGSPLSQAQRAYDAAQSPPISTVMVHVAANAPFTAEQLTALRDLSLDLELLDGATGVASPFILRFPPDADAPSGAPVFPPDIPPEYGKALDQFVALNTGLPVFLNANRTVMILSVPFDTTQTTIQQAIDGVRSEIDRLSDAGLTFAITGEDVISAEIVDGLKDDLISLNLWGALIVTLAAFVLLRDLRMALLAVVPAITGAAAVLSLSVWLGYPITVLSNVIPILLLVLGVADGVHLAQHLKDTGDLRAAVRDVGPACALTALTTALAFASIALADNAQLYEFAVLGALGTVLSYVVVITMFTVLGRIVALNTRDIPQFTSKIAQTLSVAGAARSWVTLTFCALLLGVSTYGFSQTKSWFPLYQNLPDDSPTRAVNDAIAEDFGGVFQMIVEIDGDWSRVRAVADRLTEIAGDEAVLSELNIARWLNDPDTRPTLDALDPLPETLVDRLRPEGGGARIYVSVPEPMRNDATLLQFDRLHEAAIGAGATRVIGLPAIMRQEAVSLIRDLSNSLVAAAMGATLLVALAFGSLRLVPILLIPNILPLMLTGAALHVLAAGQLSPVAVLALTIAFGIAIDDTVHYLNRYRAARARGASANAAVLHATKSAGQVIVLTTLLLTVGLCATLISDFTPIRLFGGMMILTLWAALLTDLLLLPALLTRNEPAHAPD